MNMINFVFYFAKVSIFYELTKFSWWFVAKTLYLQAIMKQIEGIKIGEASITASLFLKIT